MNSMQLSPHRQYVGEGNYGQVTHPALFSEKFQRENKGLDRNHYVTKIFSLPHDFETERRIQNKVLRLFDQDAAEKSGDVDASFFFAQATVPDSAQGPAGSEI